MPRSRKRRVTDAAALVEQLLQTLPQTLFYAAENMVKASGIPPLWVDQLCKTLT